MSTAKKKTTKLEAVEENTTTAVAVAETRELGAAADLSAWGAPPSITHKDIVIPKILPMQGLSKKVMEGQAAFGEFRDSLNNELVGTLNKPFEFIPFFMEKVWIVFEEKNGAMKFTKTVRIDTGNEDWPYEEVVNGVKIRRDRTMNFYVLLPEEVEKGIAIPYILSFRRTSLNAGKKLATTMFVKNMAAKKTPAAMVCELGGVKTQNDKGTFVVMDIKEKRPSTNVEIAKAFEWLQPIAKGAAKVDNSDLEGEAETMNSSYTDQAGTQQF